MGFVENYGRTLNFCNNIVIVGVSLGHILISGIDQEIARLFKFLYNNENIYEVLKFSHSYIYLFFTILQERSILKQNKGSKSSYKGNLFV